MKRSAPGGVDLICVVLAHEQSIAAAATIEISRIKREDMMIAP
jgi:hypothetical protein